MRFYFNSTFVNFPYNQFSLKSACYELSLPFLSALLLIVFYLFLVNFNFIQFLLILSMPAVLDLKHTLAFINVWN